MNGIERDNADNDEEFIYPFILFGRRFSIICANMFADYHHGASFF